MRIDSSSDEDEKFNMEDYKMKIERNIYAWAYERDALENSSKMIIEWSIMDATEAECMVFERQDQFLNCHACRKKSTVTNLENSVLYFLLKQCITSEIKSSINKNTR